jgi:hypothetical protein
MPRRPTKITITRYVDSRDRAAVEAAERAGYKRTPKTAGVQAEIRGYILSQAGKAGLVTAASKPENIQRFMTNMYPAAFNAVEQYKITVSQSPHNMQINENMSGKVEEHFASDEDVKAMQETIQKIAPELSSAQAGIVAQHAIAMGGVDIDVDLDDLLSKFTGLGVSGGKRKTRRHRAKKHKSHKRKHTRRR